MIPVRSGHVWAGQGFNSLGQCFQSPHWQPLPHILIISTPTALRSVVGNTLCPWDCVFVSGTEVSMKSGAVCPGIWGRSGFLCRWKGRVALLGAEGKVCAPRWEEADLGSPPILPLEFSELPAGMMLHIAAGCVKDSALRRIRGLLSMFSHTWNFRSLLPNQSVPRYMLSFVFLSFIYCGLLPLFPCPPHQLSLCVSLFPSSVVMEHSLRKQFRNLWMLVNVKISAMATLLYEHPNMTLRDPHCGLTRFPQQHCFLIKSECCLLSRRQGAE